MKRSMRLSFIAVLLLLFIPIQSMVSAEQAAFVSDITDNNQPFATHRVEVTDYQDVLQHYVKVLSDENAQSMLVDSEIVATIQPQPSQLTFTILDINADGIDELLLRYNDQIFEIYTLYQDSIVQLLNMPSLIKNTSLKLYQNGNIIISVDNGIRALYQFKASSNTFALVDAFYPTLQEEHTYYYRVTYPDILLTYEQVDERLRLKSLVPVHMENEQWHSLPKLKKEAETESNSIVQSTDTILAPLPTPSSVYSVSLSEHAVLSFANEHALHTSQIQLNIPDRTIYIEHPGHTTYLFDVLEIPTKEIIVHSADGSGSRVVKVNTQLFVTHFLEGESAIHSGHIVYLFYNRNGGISIAVPDLSEGELVEYTTSLLH